MIVDAFERGIGAAVVNALHGGAPQDPALRQRFELGLDRLGEVARRLAVDVVALGEQRPAEAEILLAQDHARARPGGGARGGKTGRS